jgi:hypothetical protein
MCVERFTRAPVVFCGSNVDTLGSSLSALNAFLAFVVAFVEETGVGVEVMLPPLPKTQSGRRRATLLKLYYVFDEPALTARLNFGDDPCLSASSKSSSEVQIQHEGEAKKRVPDLWPVLDYSRRSFTETFENIATMTVYHSTARVFVEMRGYSRVMCSLITFSSETLRAIGALDLAPSVRHTAYRS